MWSLAITLTALLAVTPAAAKKPSHTTKPCPTVTSTASVCSTCITLACISLSTVTSQKGCPTHVPTVKTSFPCSKSQCPGGCATSYVFPSSYGTTTTTKPVCPTVTKTATVCSECITLDCISLSTVSSVCGCPTKPATVTTAFPCGKACPTGCGTEVVSATVTPNCKKGGKHEDDD